MINSSMSNFYLPSLRESMQNQIYNNPIIRKAIAPIPTFINNPYQNNYNYSPAPKNSNYTNASDQQQSSNGFVDLLGNFKSLLTGEPQVSREQNNKPVAPEVNNQSISNNEEKKHQHWHHHEHNKANNDNKKASHEHHHEHHKANNDNKKANCKHHEHHNHDKAK